MGLGACAQADFVPFQSKCMARIAGIVCAVEGGLLGRRDIRWVAHQRRYRRHSSESKPRRLAGRIAYWQYCGDVGRGSQMVPPI
eukprot:6211781-Pleurochrysis_carterae.AAC.2